MIGDVNIFLNGTPGDQDLEAEAEIMIAGKLTLQNICVLPLPSPTFYRIGAEENAREFFLFRTRLSPKRAR